MTQRSSRTLLALGGRVACCCIVWFGSSIAIICELTTRTPLAPAPKLTPPVLLRTDTNKYYLSVRNFSFPLTVNYCTNTGTYLIALALNAGRECRASTPAPASRDLRLSIAIGVITALVRRQSEEPNPHLSPSPSPLTFHPHPHPHPNPNQDIGASNAGLTLLSVSFHTVIRGAIPGLVLIFALIAGLEKPEVTHLPPSSPRHPPSLCPSAPASVDPRYLRRDTRARDTRARDTP